MRRNDDKEKNDEEEKNEMNRKNEEKRVLQACNAISFSFFPKISALTTEGHRILLFHIYLYVYHYISDSCPFCLLFLISQASSKKKRNRKDLLEIETLRREKVNECK